MNATNLKMPNESIWQTCVEQLRPALSLFLLLSLVTGVLYPLIVTGLAQTFFRFEANGSLLERNGKLVGSALIGQPFSDPKYLWGRPSSSAPMPYNALASGGSNLGPTNPALIDTVKSRIEALRAADPTLRGPIPQEMVTSSASGLDPHISPQAANLQIMRIAHVRGIAPERLEAIIAAHTQGPDLGLFGEARVNVLQVNLDLDAIQ